MQILAINERRDNLLKTVTVAAARRGSKIHTEDPPGSGPDGV